MTSPCLTPTRTQSVVTLHSDVDVALRLLLLDAIEEALQQHGVERMWIDPGSTQVVVVAELEGA